jgi:ankyrin repeat protein
MKYIKLFENFDSYDPYELMIIPPNKKAEMIVGEIKKSKPNLNLVSDLIVLGANLDWQDEKWGWTPLHLAAIKGNEETARMLIDAGADLNLQDEDGYTPLNWAARVGKIEIVRMLIAAGADVNLQNEDGWTPLHLAAFTGGLEIARMLIDAGANVNVQGEDGKLPYDLTTNQELQNLLKP